MLRDSDRIMDYYGFWQNHGLSRILAESRIPIDSWISTDAGRFMDSHRFVDSGRFIDSQSVLQNENLKRKTKNSISFHMIFYDV